MSAARVLPLLLLALCPAALAQSGGADPRDAEDPRLGQDPRTISDPRDVKTDPLQDEPGPRLYDALYDAGLEDRLGELFRQNAWDLLGYIDGYCEAWLAMVERGDHRTEAGRARIAEVQAKGRRLAEVADTVLGTSRFALYVETFYGWNEDQQRQLREGQALYRQAIETIRAAPTADVAQSALTPLNQSLSRARQLGDAWGQAMVLTAIGKLQAGAGLLPEAEATLKEATRIGRGIRDLDSVWDALSLRYELAMRQADYDLAEEVLTEQHLISQDVGDETVTQRVWQQLVNLDVYRKAVIGG